MDDNKIEEMSWPIFENILQAHELKDYKLLTRDFCEDSSELLPTEDEFNEITEEINDSLGNMISATYLGCVYKDEVNLVLWKAGFANSEGELLWHIYLGYDMKVQAIWVG